MKTKKSLEDYLKTIYEIQLYGEVRGSYIAAAMGYSKPTVSMSLRDMEREGYIEMDKNRCVTLTDKGRDVAFRVQERHAAFEKLLIRLGVDQTTAHEDACDMEHTVSETSFKAIKNLIRELEAMNYAPASLAESVNYD